MAISKDCILNAIYPLEGHEAAIGLDLLSHPERKNIVERTIETQQTFVAGPVELVEGGVAFISYTPIFDKTKPGITNFWGVTDIVIKENSLLREAGLQSSEGEFLFALRGYNGTGHQGAVFFGNEEVFNQNPVTVQIDLPIGNWILAAIPARGWAHYGDQDKTLIIILLSSAFIISILIWLFSKAMLQIRTNEKELKAVFDSLESLIIEFSAEGEYLKIASSNNELLYLPKEKLEGKNLFQIFGKEKADFFLKAIQKCIETRKLVVIEYPLEVSGEKLWFMARISYKSANSIIFNAYDITERKRQEERLQESERQLQELNETKNKFFSIIAHDLRSPLGGQKAVIDLILEEYESLDEPTRKELLINLKESSYHLYNLLENLLEWSLSQSGKIDMKPQKFNLHGQYNDMLMQFQKDARMKNIQFKNELDKDAAVYADINLTEIILRNLISNAIKFTKEGGEIKVQSQELIENGIVYQNISVIDTGIGMSDEKLSSLFKIDKTQSTPGTADEKGNGLGLLLCKEFAEKQNSKLTYSSTKGEGSTFSFKLRVN
jgi:PAS domain S-box-containing protein